VHSLCCNNNSAKFYLCKLANIAFELFLKSNAQP
jgi:hypothetical protein